jgi:hypothetical protein
VVSGWFSDRPVSTPSFDPVVATCSDRICTGTASALGPLLALPFGLSFRALMCAWPLLGGPLVPWALLGLMLHTSFLYTTATDGDPSLTPTLAAELRRAHHADRVAVAPPSPAPAGHRRPPALVLATTATAIWPAAPRYGGWSLARHRSDLAGRYAVAAVAIVEPPQPGHGGRRLPGGLLADLGGAPFSLRACVAVHVV